MSAIDHGKYKAENITTLSDGGSGEPLPTKENIITAIRQLVDGAKEDDILFFHCTSAAHCVERPNHFEASPLSVFRIQVLTSPDRLRARNPSSRPKWRRSRRIG